MILKVPFNTLHTSVNNPVHPAFPLDVLIFSTCPTVKVIVLGIGIVKLPPLPFAINGGEKETPLELTISYVN